MSLLEKISTDFPTPELRKQHHGEILQRIADELKALGIQDSKQMASSILHHMEKGAKIKHAPKKLPTAQRDLDPLRCGEKTPGSVIKVVRYCNYEEATATLKENGLVPRPGHERNPKWVASDKAKIDPKSLGKPGSHDYKIEITLPERKVGDFLKRHEDKPDVEPFRYAVPSVDVKAFNTYILDLRVSPIR